MIPASPTDPAVIREEAARWFSLSRSGDMTELDRRRRDAWIDSDDDARAAYARLERYWEILGAVGDEPIIMAAREQDARAHDRRRFLRRGAAAAAAAVVVATTTWTALDSGLADSIRPLGRGADDTLRTVAGQRTTTTLADGSVITLDSQSELKVVEMAAVRRIELVHGRAFFQVAKDPTRPFLVHAGDKTVHAIGTAFDVRLEDDAVTVTLVEGKVRVDQPKRLFRSAKTADLVPGGKLVAASDRDWVVSKVDAGRETSWLSGRLTFFHDPLSTALTEVNRYSDRKIVFVGGAVPDTRIVGVFGTGDTEAFASALELNGIARIVAREPDRIELAPR